MECFFFVSHIYLSIFFSLRFFFVSFHRFFFSFHRITLFFVSQESQHKTFFILTNLTHSARIGSGA